MFAVGVTEERQETKLCENGEGDGGHIDADRLRGGKDSSKVIVDNVDGGEGRVGGNNRMKQSVDSGEGNCTSYFTSIFISTSSSVNYELHPTSPSPPALDKWGFLRDASQEGCT